MQIIAGLFLIGVVLYLIGWYLGIIAVNMAAFLLIIVLITGAYWLIDRIHFMPQRKLAVKKFQATMADSSMQNADNQKEIELKSNKQIERLLARPWWLEWTAGIFPVLLAVFVLRTAFYEPFYIPSGSMMPTLKVGDFILVDKNQYGIKIPIINKKITSGSPIERGDIVVFHYPLDRNVDYIKRVIGLPGDTVSYYNKELSVNGEIISASKVGNEIDDSSNSQVNKFKQTIGEHQFNIYQVPGRPELVDSPIEFEQQNLCKYDVPSGFTCKIPTGHYLMLGDNRDNSGDSRYWGFVPEQDIVGKAVYVWLNFKHLWRHHSLTVTADEK